MQNIDIVISQPNDPSKKSKTKHKEIKDLDRRIRRLKKIEKRLRPFKHHLDAAKKNVEDLLNTDSVSEIRSLRCPETPIIKLFQVIGIIFELSKVEVSKWEFLDDHNEEHWTNECSKFCNNDVIRKMLGYDLKKITENDKDLLRGLCQDPTMAVTNLSKVSMTCGILAEYLMALYSYIVAIDNAESDEFEVEDLNQVRRKIKELKKEKQDLIGGREAKEII